MLLFEQKLVDISLPLCDIFTQVKHIPYKLNNRLQQEVCFISQHKILILYIIKTVRLYIQNVYDKQYNWAFKSTICSFEIGVCLLHLK